MDNITLVLIKGIINNNNTSKISRVPPMLLMTTLRIRTLRRLKMYMPRKQLPTPSGRRIIQRR